MTFVEGLQLLTSSGAFAIGMGIFKWALGVETRLAVIETRQEKTP
jgi:hypothetical protein